MSSVMPCWAQEMGMTEEDYWSGLQETGPSQADLTGIRNAPVHVTQVRAVLLSLCLLLETAILVMC